MRTSILAATLAFPAAAHGATASIAPFGEAPDGAVRLITLANGHGMTVRFSTRGGAITAIEVSDRKGRIASVVLGRPDFAGWEKAGSFNTVVGRYANRIGGGGFTLDGRFYPIAGANAHKVILHGGPNAFASRMWTAETFERPDAAGAVMSYVSADGENGFPGALTVRMTYTLTESNVLRIDYRATTTKPTVVNLTNHTYFNLGGDESGPVYNQIMQVFASKVTPTDADQIPTGELLAVDGTPFDFRRPTRIGDRVFSPDPQMMIGQGIDHNFVLDPAPAGALRTAVRLQDPESGRQMEVRTTEPGVQIYSGNRLDGTIVGAHGRTLRQSDGIAFETQHFPDSPNKPAFPTTVLRPGQVFQSTTEYAFSTDATPFPEEPAR
ncbi:aldose epimerase family protein [Sphingomonas tabacisoli]|uniref:Aldose 1-epimerase n=1 Tax=Sphingomonas tabacisoli TaxID=2249466 RepID=A0ABW4I157_9SPHN